MKKTYTRAGILIITTLLFAGVALAADAPSVTGQGRTIADGIKDIGSTVDLLTSNVVSRLITLFATAGMAAFFYGLVVFILATRDGVPAKIDNGKKFMLWSMVALFVMFSIWGIVKYAQRVLGVTDNQIVIPQVIIGGSTSGTPAGSGGKTPAGYCPNGRAYYSASEAATCGDNIDAGGGWNPATGGSAAPATGPTAGQPCYNGGQAGHYVAQNGSLSCVADAQPASGSTVKAGGSCTIDGKAGHYVQGGASRDYALYCSPDASSSSSNTSSAKPLGYCPDGRAYYNAAEADTCGDNKCSSIGDPDKCRAASCTWDTQDLACVP